MEYTGFVWQIGQTGALASFFADEIFSGSWHSATVISLFVGGSGILIGTKDDEDRNKLDCGVDDSLGNEVLGVMAELGVNGVFLLVVYQFLFETEYSYPRLHMQFLDSEQVQEYCQLALNNINLGLRNPAKQGNF